MCAVQLGVQGILVLDTRKGGPAAKAGIQGTSRDQNGRLMLGDIIVAFNRKPIRWTSHLRLQQLCRSAMERR
jgi:S1-C subfamily serine protease